MLNALDHESRLQSQPDEAASFHAKREADALAEELEVTITDMAKGSRSQLRLFALTLADRNEINGVDVRTLARRAAYAIQTVPRARLYGDKKTLGAGWLAELTDECRDYVTSVEKQNDEYARQYEEWLSEQEEPRREA